MGNCTSKKSGKVLKLSSFKKPTHTKMEKEESCKGLSKKIVPFTRGEATSFGFKRRPASALPAPVTLTRQPDAAAGERHGILKHVLRDAEECQSGSSVESLCHGPQRCTPRMARRKDLHKPNPKSTMELSGTVNNNNNNNNNNNIIINNNKTNLNSNNYGSPNNININGQANRFGFRQSTPPRPIPVSAKHPSQTPHVTFSNTPPYSASVDTASSRTRSGGRSRSEGPREAFFKQTVQPACSVGSMSSMQCAGSFQPRASFTSTTQPLRPGRFTLETSQLPRPQFPVRMPDTKTVKTVTNYYRRGGHQGAATDSNSSKEGSLNEDSGFESQHSGGHRLRENESPGYSVRKRLPVSGKKLEMKVVGNKFELLSKEEDEMTEVSVFKIPSSLTSTTAVINTGLVEQRTNQYLRRISQNLGATNTTKHSNLTGPASRYDTSSDSSRNDEGFGLESEEEKLFKDSRKSEKRFIMSDGSGDTDDLPGEAMAEEISVSSEEDTASASEMVLNTHTPVNAHTLITPNSIRLDALKLSQQFKAGTIFTKPQHMIEDSFLGVLTSCGDADDETFPSDSILEQLSSEESDSLGDKRDPEKKEPDLELELECNSSQTDAECAAPRSPGTPSNASNSLSLSEGRDFLIDDEIADQPQLCLTDNATSYHDSEVKTHNSRTLTNTDNFVTASEVSNTVLLDAISKAANKPVGMVAPTPAARQDTSVGTLSPCESITSDDLMLDLDEVNDRLNYDNCSVDGADSCNGDDLFKDSSVSSHRNSIGGGSIRMSRGSRGGSGSSTPGSPRSGTRSSRPSTGDEEKSSYQHMFHDIVSIKTMLLKLKRVLSESEGGVIENGAKLSGEGIEGIALSDPEEMLDLRRQVIFLQQQLEERERTVHDLQEEMTKTGKVLQDHGAVTGQCNAATQTDRVRPVSTGPSIVQNLPSEAGNMVSEGWSKKPTLGATISHDERNTHSFTVVQPSCLSNHAQQTTLPSQCHQMNKIMEKVKEMSFKPVDPVRHKQPTVFKITKIDLVLKSDNYGKKEMTKT